MKDESEKILSAGYMVEENKIKEESDPQHLNSANEKPPLVPKYTGS